MLWFLLFTKNSQPMPSSWDIVWYFSCHASCCALCARLPPQLTVTQTYGRSLLNSRRLTCLDILKVYMASSWPSACTGILLTLVVTCTCRAVVAQQGQHRVPDLEFCHCRWCISFWVWRSFCGLTMQQDWRLRDNNCMYVHDPYSCKVRIRLWYS